MVNKIMPEEESKKHATRRRTPAKRSVKFSVPVKILTPWVVVVAAVVVLALGVFGVVSVPGSQPNRWNAVFLTNGQVYFGHIARQSSDTIVLQNVYYLQVTPPLQQSTPDDAASDTQSAPSNARGNAQKDITLFKLGNELHGPTDEMRINRERVLFTETLRDDARVVQAITSAQNKTPTPLQAPAPPSAPAPAPQTGE